MTPSSRRTPDELLEALKKAEGSGRGQLRVYLGMCAGVGKTYSMLESARIEKARGVNVVIGVVETHGRVETAKLVEGLTIIPKNVVNYKDTLQQEMDLDRLLAERPALVLVDELAHTNVPGSRHTKRFQDVLELLNAGIHVYTTVNIQHIESHNDQVAQITGIRVRETVPDSIFEMANEIEIVDLSTPQLLQRLSEGKVYLGEKAVQARANFFKEEQLHALQELALRFVAKKVDQDLNSQMTISGIEGPWSTTERLLVALSHSPYSARLIRTTRRMAYHLDAPWIALHVQTGEQLKHEDQEMLEKNITLARDLGAEVMMIADHDIVHAIQKVSADRNVTQIVMGRPDRRFFKDLLSRGTLLDKLVHLTSKVDIHVIRAERKSKYKGFHIPKPEIQTGIFPYYMTFWFMTAVSFLCRASLDLLGYRALGSIFLLAILTVASFGAIGPTFLAALISAVVWNFFFIPPTWTFSVSSPEDFMMVASFFVAALVGGILTARVKRHESVLELRESETRLLYELVKNLSDVSDETQASQILSETIKRKFLASSVILLENAQKSDPRKSFGKIKDEKDLAVALWSMQNGRTAGWTTQTLSGSTCLCLPIKGNSGVLGVVIFYPHVTQVTLSTEALNFLETILAQTAIVLERLTFREAAEATKLYEASEKLHQTLLNSVSHELRTPITALIGSATALDDESTVSDRTARQSLIDEITRSARRLDRVVGNLLDVSRLEKGTHRLKKEWFELGDLFVQLRSEFKSELSSRDFHIKGDTEILFEGDFQLIHQAFFQLISNAIKYSRANSCIEIMISSFKGKIKISVQDEGAGIPDGLESLIFDKFYRVPGSSTGGLGLGLSIVKNIIELHEGQVSANNRTVGRGAEFVVILPRSVLPSLLQKALE